MDEKLDKGKVIDTPMELECELDRVLNLMRNNMTLEEVLEILSIRTNQIQSLRRSGN